MSQLPHIAEIPLKYKLFLKRRFAPLFVAQFLGAFNDNMIRSGLVVLIAYADNKGIKLAAPAEILVTICSALLVVPFLIFSSVAGQLADKYEKGRLVIYTKIAEVGIMTVACYGFATHDINLLMFMLFVSGTHSTFFGPIKYSILPEHLKSDELLAGNGFIAGGSYLGILFGLICGGLLIEVPGNVIGYAAVLIASTGLLAAVLIPSSPPAAPEIKIGYHWIRGTAEMLEHAKRHRVVFLSILGLSWFLLQGSVFMAQFSNYAKSVVHANNEVYTLFLTIFSLGIALGSVFCDKLLKGEITARLSPYALLGVSVFTYLMLFFTPVPQHEGLMDVHEFITAPEHLPMLFSMLMVAVCGGIYIVPLYAILQSKSEARSRSQVIAASNVFDSLFMTIAAVVSAVLLQVGFVITDLFIVTATLNLFVAIYALRHRQHGIFS